MTDRQLEDKFRSLAEGILPPQQVDVLFNQLQHLPELRNDAW